MRTLALALVRAQTHRVHMWRAPTAWTRRRSLYGQCIFSTKTSASTALADELVAATKTPQFAASALQLQAAFNSTQATFEAAYWAATAAGTCTDCSCQDPHTMHSQPAIKQRP